MIKYKKFRIEEVFCWQSQKEIDPLKIKELTVKSEKKYPFYGQATTNNGIISYESLKDDVLNNKEGKPTILIHSNNQYVLFLNTPFYLKDGHGATSVLQSDWLNENNAMYIITCIKKIITQKFTYNEKATKIALKNTEIELPVNEDESLNLEYMENIIKDNRRKIMNKIENVINNEGLYSKINHDEESSINQFEDKKVIFKKIKIKELFTHENGNTDIQQKDINNKGLYVVSSGEQNHGIIGKSDIEAKIINGNSITVDMFGIVNYRPYGYKMVTHARVFALVFKEKELTENEGIFFATQMKFLKEIFSYNNMATWNNVKNIEIDVPIKDNMIDYNYINNFVNGLKKEIVKPFPLYLK